MPIVHSVKDGRQYEVQFPHDDIALLAVFFREVVFKNRQELITAEMMHKQLLGDYKNAIKEEIVIRGGKRFRVKQIWRFAIEEPIH